MVGWAGGVALPLWGARVAFLLSCLTFPPINGAADDDADAEGPALLLSALARQGQQSQPPPPPQP